MKVSIALKIVTGLMLLLGLFFIVETFVFISQNTIISVISELGLALITVVICIGIFMSNKIALYCAPVLAAYYIYGRVSNIPKEPAGNFGFIIWTTLYTVFLILSLVNIIKNRRQIKQ